MVARSNPSLHQNSPHPGPDDEELDPDSASTPVEPVRPSEGPRQQALRLTAPPSKVWMIAGGIAAVLVGVVIGYWLGKRRAQRPARPIRRVAQRVDSAMDLAPVALHLLGNPLVRALALRMLFRQISRRIDH